MRRSEWVLALYFAYVTVLSRVLPVSAEIRARTIIVNGLLLCFYVAMLKWFRNEHVRNWIPLALMLLGYKEMGWLALPVPDHHLEQTWVAWDRLLLREYHLRAIIESAGPLFPSLFELCYLLVYALPAFTMTMVYLYRRSWRAEELLFVYLLGLFLSYAQFPFWPSEPPRIVFPGEDAPTVDTLLRQFNHWILGGYGIHTSVFPSAHVSGAVAASFGMRRVFEDRPWIYRAVFVYGALVTIATVYGRYHYAADAAAGIVVGCVAAWLGLSKTKGYPHLPTAAMACHSLEE